MTEQWRQLNFLTPNISGIEIPPDPEIHNQIIEEKRYFEKLDDVYTETFITDQNYVWQMVDYNPQRTQTSQEIFRGYLMVEPEDIPRATQLLNSIFQYEKKERNHEGRFKWLIRKMNPSLFIIDRNKQVGNVSQLGSYPNLEDIDPRIVIYAHNHIDIHRILSSLASLDEWKELENNRRSKFQSDPPIRGTTHFTDQDGNDWHSLS